MTAQITPIDKNKHKALKVKSSDLSHASSQHICPALAQEFPQLTSEFPIVFVKDNDNFHSVVMMGLKPGENLFLQEGKWQANYVPAALRNYPFSLMKMAADNDNMAVCVDTASKLVNEKEGQALFNADGVESDYLKNIANFLTRLMGQGKFSDDFSQYLASKELFEEQTITVKLDDGTDHRLNGVFRVDEEKLNQLDNDTFLELRTKGYLPAIYAHLASLRQVNNLARLNAQRATETASKAKAAAPAPKAKAKAH